MWRFHLNPSLAAAIVAKKGGTFRDAVNVWSVLQRRALLHCDSPVKWAVALRVAWISEHMCAIVCYGTSGSARVAYYYGGSEFSAVVKTGAEY